MVEKSDTIPFQCHCGYDPTGFDSDGICPECGRSRGERKGWLSAPLWSWRHCGSWWLRFGFACSVLTLVLGIASSVLVIYLVDELSGGGFKGGTAGIAILYPPLLWLFVQLPVVVFSLIILGIGRNRSKKAQGAGNGAAMLSRYSGACMLFGMVGSLIVIIIGTVLIFQ